MTNFLFKLTVPVLLIASLQGCVIAVNTDDEGRWGGDWRKEQERNLERIHNLEMGRTTSSIKAEFGKPEFVDAFKRDGMTYKVLFYRTCRVHDDGRTTRDETTPLVFVDDALVGWGPSAINKAAP